MTSTLTGLETTLVDPPNDRWSVPWLPERLLTRDLAITALTISELVHTTRLRTDPRACGLLDALARELHLTGPDAVVLMAPSTGAPATPPPSKPFADYRDADWDAYDRWSAEAGVIASAVVPDPAMRW